MGVKKGGSFGVDDSILDRMLENLDVLAKESSQKKAVEISVAPRSLSKIEAERKELEDLGKVIDTVNGKSITLDVDTVRFQNQTKTAKAIVKKATDEISKMIESVKKNANTLFNATDANNYVKNMTIRQRYGLTNTEESKKLQRELEQGKYLNSIAKKELMTIKKKNGQYAANFSSGIREANKVVQQNQDKIEKELLKKYYGQQDSVRKAKEQIAYHEENMERSMKKATAAMNEFSESNKIDEQTKAFERQADAVDRATQSTQNFAKAQSKTASGRSGSSTSAIDRINSALDVEKNKLKEIERQQAANENGFKRLAQMKNNYHEYAGYDSNKPIYDLDKLMDASKSLKNFNSQLNKRNEFQSKYDELMRIIQEDYLGKYGVYNSVYQDIDQLINSSSDLKYLKRLSENGIKGEKSKDISNAFANVVNRLRGWGAGIGPAIESGDVYGVHFYKEIEEEEISLAQTRQRLFEERQHQLTTINRLEQELRETSSSAADAAQDKPLAGLSEKEASAVIKYLDILKKRMKDTYDEAWALKQGLKLIDDIKTGNLEELKDRFHNGNPASNAVLGIMSGMPVKNQKERNTALRSLMPEKYDEMMRQAEEKKEELKNEKSEFDKAWEALVESMIGGDAFKNYSKMQKGKVLKELSPIIDEINKAFLNGELDGKRFKKGKYANEYLEYLRQDKEMMDSYRQAKAGELDADSLFGTDGTKRLTEEKAKALRDQAAAYDELIKKKREYYNIPLPEPKVDEELLERNRVAAAAYAERVDAAPKYLIDNVVGSITEKIQSGQLTSEQSLEELINKTKELGWQYDEAAKAWIKLTEAKPQQQDPTEPMRKGLEITREQAEEAWNSVEKILNVSWGAFGRKGGMTIDLEKFFDSKSSVPREDFNQLKDIIKKGNEPDQSAKVLYDFLNAKLKTLSVDKQFHAGNTRKEKDARASIQSFMDQIVKYINEIAADYNYAQVELPKDKGDVADKWGRLQTTQRNTKKKIAALETQRVNGEFTDPDVENEYIRLTQSLQRCEQQMHNLEAEFGQLQQAEHQEAEAARETAQEQLKAAEAADQRATAEENALSAKTRGRLDAITEWKELNIGEHGEIIGAKTEEELNSVIAKLYEMRNELNAISKDDGFEGLSQGMSKSVEDMTGQLDQWIVTAQNALEVAKKGTAQKNGEDVTRREERGNRMKEIIEQMRSNEDFIHSGSDEKFLSDYITKLTAEEADIEAVFDDFKNKVAQKKKELIEEASRSEHINTQTGILDDFLRSLSSSSDELTVLTERFKDNYQRIRSEESNVGEELEKIRASFAEDTIQKALSGMNISNSSSDNLFKWIQDNCSETEQKIFRVADGIEQFRDMLRRYSAVSGSRVDFLETKDLDLIALKNVGGIAQENAEKVVRSQEEIQAEIDKTNKVIEIQEQWMRALAFLNRDYSTGGSRQKAYERLKNATGRVVAYRHNEYAGDTVAEDRTTIDYWRAYKQAEADKVAQSRLSSEKTDITEMEYNEALKRMLEAKQMHTEILQDAQNRLKILQQELETVKQISEQEKSSTVLQQEYKSQNKKMGLRYYESKEKYDEFHGVNDTDLRNYKDNVVEVVNTTNKLAADATITCGKAETAAKRFFETIGNQMPLLSQWKDEIIESIQNGTFAGSDSANYGGIGSGAWNWSIEKQEDGKWYIHLNQVKEEYREIVDLESQLAALKGRSKENDLDYLSEKQRAEYLELESQLIEEINNKTNNWIDATTTLSSKYSEMRSTNAGLEETMSLFKELYALNAKGELGDDRFGDMVKSENKLLQLFNVSEQELTTIKQQIIDEIKQSKDVFKTRSEEFFKTTINGYKEYLDTVANNHETGKFDFFGQIDQETFDQVLAKVNEINEAFRKGTLDAESLTEEWAQYYARFLNKDDRSGFGARYLDKAPDGWKRIENATTAPQGYEWWSNGASRFSNEYQHALVKVAEAHEEAAAAAREHAEAESSVDEQSKRAKEYFDSFHNRILDYRFSDDVSPFIPMDGGEAPKDAYKNIKNELHHRAVGIRQLQNEYDNFDTSRPVRELERLEEELREAEVRFAGTYMAANDFFNEKLDKPSNRGGADKIIRNVYDEIMSGNDFFNNESWKRNNALIRGRTTDLQSSLQEIFRSMNTSQASSSDIYWNILENGPKAEQEIWKVNDGLEEFQKVLRGVALSSGGTINFAENLGLDVVTFNLETIKPVISNELDQLNQIAQAYQRITDIEDQMNETDDGTKKFEKLENELELAKEKTTEFENQYKRVIIELTDGSKVDIPLDENFAEAAENRLSDSEKIKKVLMITPETDSILNAYSTIDQYVDKLVAKKGSLSGSIKPGDTRTSVPHYNKLEDAQNVVDRLSSSIHIITTMDPDGIWGDNSNLQKANRLLEDYKNRVESLKKEPSQAVGASTTPSVEGLHEEAGEFKANEKNAEDAAKAKGEFAAANERVLGSVDASLEGLQQEGNLMQDIKDTANGDFSGDNTFDKLDKNLEDVAESSSRAKDELSDLSKVISTGFNRRTTIGIEKNDSDHDDNIPIGGRLFTTKDGPGRTTVHSIRQVFDEKGQPKILDQWEKDGVQHTEYEFEIIERTITNYNEIVREGVKATIDFGKAEHDLALELNKSNPNIGNVKEYNLQLIETTDRLQAAQDAAHRFAEENNFFFNDRDFGSKYLYQMYEDDVGALSTRGLSREQVRYNNAVERQQQSVQKEIDKTNTALSRQQIKIEDIRATYDQELFPGVHRPVKDQGNLTELRGLFDSIQTKINNFKNDTSTYVGTAINELNEDIAEYKRKAIDAKNHDNVVQHGLTGVELEDAISKQVKKYDELIFKTKQYGDETKLITESLEDQKRVLEEDLKKIELQKHMTDDELENLSKDDKVTPVHNDDAASIYDINEARFSSFKTYIKNIEELKKVLRSAEQQYAKIGKGDPHAQGNFDQLVNQAQTLYDIIDDLNDKKIISDERIDEARRFVNEFYQKLTQIDTPDAGKSISPVNSLYKAMESNLSKIQKLEIDNIKLSGKDEENAYRMQNNLREMARLRQENANIAQQIVDLGGDEESVVTQLLTKLQEMNVVANQQREVTLAGTQDSAMAKSDKWIASLNKLLDGGKYIEGFEQRLRSTIVAINEFRNQVPDMGIDQIVSKMHELQHEVNDINVGKGFAENKAALEVSLRNVQYMIDNFVHSNSGMGQKFKSMFADLSQKVAGVENTAQVRQMVAEVARLKSEVIEAGKATKSFGDIFGSAFKNKLAQLAMTYLSWFSLIRYIRQGIQEVRNLDTALIDLRKTTTMTTAELDNFYYSANDIAKQMGVTTQAIIQQAAAWSRFNKIDLLCGNT